MKYKIEVFTKDNKVITYAGLAQAITEANDNPDAYMIAFEFKNKVYTFLRDSDGIFHLPAKN